MGCGCSACGGSNVAAMCDPHGMAMGHIDGILPSIVFPSDIRRRKNELDPFVRALDITFNAGCATLSAEEAITYDGFSKAWREFYQEAEPFLFTASKWDELLRYQDTIGAWEDIFAAKCGFTGAHAQPSRNAPAPPGSSGPGITELAEGWLGTIKVVAIVTGVVAAAVVVTPLVVDFVSARMKSRAATTK
jgi:hypothetical protein